MRVRTGVEGLDGIAGGGFPEETSIVLQGPPGNEKDAIGLQFLAEGLRAGDAVLVVVSSTPPSQYVESLAKLGVDVEAAIAAGRLKIVDWHSHQEETVAGVEERGHVFRCSVDLTNVGIAIARALASLPAGTSRRAVLEILSPALQVFEVGQVYAFAQTTKAKLARQRVTALFLLEKEMHVPATVTSVSQPFDGVIDIERRREGDSIVREIGVLSLKDTVPDAKFHILRFLPGQGVRVDAPPEAAAAGPARSPAPTEPEPPAPGRADTKTTEAPPSPSRAEMILRIAEERIQVDPRDADALFAKASALAATKDFRGALASLDALIQVNDTYPGLWVLRTKLFANLGDTRAAQESRRKAEQISRREELKARTGETVPCPLCEGPVPVDEQECPNCGARFIEELDLAEELDSLGKAAIQEQVGEDLKVEPETGKPSRRPGLRGAAAREVAPTAAPSPPPPAEARRGMTNGLARESLRSATGRTNGLTNGLRGRTNGLTNGLRGRTNGLTNGLRGRTNGLTNGLAAGGRTNGLTNGLVNGLASLRRGMTNGLTNGNGFTNGLGSKRFSREAAMARWKLYVIPLLSVALLLLPLLGPAGVSPRVYPITIDGAFADWAALPLAAAPARAGLPSNIDLVRWGVTDNVDSLAFYFEVNGTALAGGGSPPRMDTFRAFLDVDRDAGTGYLVRGLGADRLLEVSGAGGSVNVSTLWEWDTNRDPRDWGGWIKGASIRAAASGPRAEAEVDWLSLVAQKRPIDAFLHAQGWNGTADEAEHVVSTTEGSLRVVETPVVAEVVSGSNLQLLRLDFDAAVRPVSFDSLSVTLTGTAPTTATSMLHLVDGQGTGLVDRIPVSGRVTFQFPVRTLAVAETDRLFVVADTVSTNGDTIGARLDLPADVGAGTAAITISRAPSPRAVGYLGSVPAPATVDGGFSEWTNVLTDPTGDAGVSPSIDLTEYAFYLNSQQASAYVRVAGRSLDGAVVPAATGSAPMSGVSRPDSDRDTVPDMDDLMPNDFNNDGTPDTATGGDHDGDGSTDYPGGPDHYLNTTIPSTFPAAYANRPVSLYIGPSFRPVAFGEDTVRVFLDSDNDTATGFRVNAIGADFLVEIRGRDGRTTSQSLSNFTGTNPLDWSWAAVESVPAASDYSRVELGFDVLGRGLLNDTRAYFEVRDWSGATDTTSGATIRTGTRDISGNEKWFFRDTSTTGTGCNTNLAASTTAGLTATSTTLSSSQSICWFTPLDQPDSVSGSWEVILDIDKVTDATTSVLPDANGDVNAWSAAGCTEANEYQCVDESTNDGDTSYTVSNASTVTDSLFSIQDWSSPPSPLTIVSVQVEASCRKLVSPSTEVNVLVKSGGTTSAGGTKQNCPNSPTYVVWSDTWTTDPSDAAAWTLSDINALQAGVRDNDATTREVRVSHVKVIITFAPVYSVEIDKCTNEACTSYVSLYGPTNGNTYGGDVTFTTGTIGAQTLGSTERIRFKVALTMAGSVSVRYNGPNPSPGTDDSRATVPVPEFQEIASPILAAMIIVPLYRHVRRRRRAAPAT